MSELTRRRSLERLSKPDLITKVIETEREMHARELHHFEAEKALVEIRDWMLNPGPVNWLTLDTILTRALKEDS